MLGKMDEKKLLKWANSMVEDESLHIKKFNDKTIPNCRFLIALLEHVDKDVSAMEESMVDHDIISDGK